MSVTCCVHLAQRMSTQRVAKYIMIILTIDAAKLVACDVETVHLWATQLCPELCMPCDMPATRSLHAEQGRLVGDT